MADVLGMHCFSSGFLESSLLPEAARNNVMHGAYNTPPCTTVYRLNSGGTRACAVSDRPRKNTDRPSPDGHPCVSCFLNSVT